MPQRQGRDKHSYGNNRTVEITHFHLDWLIDFDRQCVSGSITHTCRFIADSDGGDDDAVQYLQLDCRSLSIEKATLVSLNDEDGEEISVLQVCIHHGMR